MMQIIDTLSENNARGRVAAIGFFDGVHAGHRSLIADVQRIAAEKALDAGIVTFRRHPKSILTGQSVLLITSLAERLSLLTDTGVDYCILLDFTPEMALLSAYDFIALLRDRYNVRHLVIGYDHRFGHNRNESFDDYCRYGDLLGVGISRSEAYSPEGEKISSSILRRLLDEGRVREANRRLTYDYALEGRVVSGRQLGRCIGFPTANIEPPTEKVVPAGGVYAVRVYLDDGVGRGGMLNIGTRPTVNDEYGCCTIEVHIFDFDRSIYGENVRVEFVDRLRDERRMDDLEALRAQLVEDKRMAQGLL